MTMTDYIIAMTPPHHFKWSQIAPPKIKGGSDPLAQII